MTRTSPSIYDDDFFAWTQEQAAALRQLSEKGGIAGVDVVHVAEEIEDLGKRDLREVRSFLQRLFEHLIKIKSCPNSADVLHWRAEARSFRRSAAEAYAPSMRRLLDMARMWRVGRKAAGEALGDLGLSLSGPSDCPFTLDDILLDSFDIDDALARLDARPSP